MSTDNYSKAATQITSQSGNDERGTPMKTIRTLQRVIGGRFDLDPCSGAEPKPIAENRFTQEDDGLSQDWVGHDTVFVNPPYSNLEPWMEKTETEFKRNHPGAPELIICLLPGYTSSDWFQVHAAESDYLCLIDKRLQFAGTDNSAPFPSIITIFGELDEDQLGIIRSLGRVYEKVDIDDELVQQQLPGISKSSEDDFLGSDAWRLDLRSLSVGDKVEVTLDDDVYGFPNGIPSDVTVTVLAGESRNEVERDAVLCVDEETETYFCFSEKPHTQPGVHCAVERMGYTSGWRQVGVINVDLAADTGHVAAIEPYGAGTAYVC